MLEIIMGQQREKKNVRNTRESGKPEDLEKKKIQS